MTIFGGGVKKGGRHELTPRGRGFWNIRFELWPGSLILQKSRLSCLTRGGLQQIGNAYTHTHTISSITLLGVFLGCLLTRSGVFLSSWKRRNQKASSLFYYLLPPPCSKQAENEELSAEENTNSRWETNGGKRGRRNELVEATAGPGKNRLCGLA